MKTKILLSSLVLAGLAVAQPISAATRSADSLPQAGAQPATSVERAGSIYGGILIATSGSKSPG